MTRARRWRPSLVVVALLAALVAFLIGGAPRSAWAAPAGGDLVVVQVPRLGPMLLPGTDAGTAAHAYVDGLLRRDVFPEANAAELRAWADGVAAAADRAPTLAALRATGRPLIGVQLGKATDIAGGTDAWMAHRSEFATAIIEHGGVPVFLPPGGDTRGIDRLVHAVDGLVLVGGADVSTELQHGVHADPRFATNLKRDRYEQQVIQRALAAGLHVHAVCRGSQLLQVTFGGRLVQDIPTSGLATLDHGSGQNAGEKHRHAIRFTADSVIGRALGGRLSVDGIHFHHQSADPTHMAPGFRVVAWSNDGIAEAIEGLDGRVVGVQVHPESAGKGTALRRAFFGSTLMEPARAVAAARPPAASPAALGFKSERAVTLALHSAVGARTTQTTWNGWRSPAPPR